MKIRVISMLLAVALFLSLVPAPASADNPLHTEMQNQIRHIYDTARRRSGMSSFEGYCATWVTWQIYLLGIDSSRRGLDGNQLYEYYSAMEETPTGYDVTAYPASRYTIAQALAAITDDGRTDAYNIMIGIDKTPSADGMRYGHAVFIHAIIDGMVHYTESTSSYISGTYWPEGYPVMCTVDQFVAGYGDGWVTALDGVIHFGQKTYSDYSTNYPASMYAMAKENTEVYSEPCDPSVDPGSKPLGKLHAGDILDIRRLYHTPEDKYWYQFTRDGITGYVEADKAEVLRFRYDDVQAQGIYGIRSVHKGSDHPLMGNLYSENNRISAVKVLICREEDKTNSPVLLFQMDTDTRLFNLNNWQVREALKTSGLELGRYRMIISANARNYYVKDGELIRQDEEVELWESTVEVVPSWNGNPVVGFFASGGDSGVDQTLRAPGQPVGPLPEATRPGYRFEGWYTLPEGGEQVSEDFIIQGNTGLYAQWTPDTSAFEGWQLTAEGWKFYEGGQVHTGWLEYNDIRFYTRENGEMARGWNYIDRRLYYFSPSGAVVSGWEQVGSDVHYFEEDGKGARGWKTLDGDTYYFGDYGKMITGWVTDGSGWCYLDENGRLATSETEIDGTNYLFDENGRLLTEAAPDSVDDCYVIFDGSWGS